MRELIKVRFNNRLSLLAVIFFALIGSVVLAFIFAADKTAVNVLEGEYETFHGDDFAGNHVQHYDFIKTNDGKRYELNFVGGARPQIESGARVKLKGKLRKDGKLDVQGVENNEGIKKIKEASFHFSEPGKYGKVYATHTSTDKQPPTVPTNLTATVLGATRAKLSWNSSTDDNRVNGYEIYRDDVFYTTTGHNSANPIQEYTIVHNPSTTHTYKVRAYDSYSGTNTGDPANHISGFSNSISVTSPANYRAAVILINFTNETSQPFTKDSVKARIFSDADSVSNYYREMSHGKAYLGGHIDAVGDVFGWYTISSTNENCSTQYANWGTAAKQAAAADGYSDANYELVQYVFRASCGWSGLAYGGTPRQSVVAVSGTTFSSNSTHTSIHEFGHNVGWAHGTKIQCEDANKQPVSMSGICWDRGFGYDDPFDVMGGGNRHSRNFNRYTEEWYSSSNVLDVTTSGTYALEPAETNTSGVKALRILRERKADGSPGLYYYLEFRQPFGTYWENFPTTDAAVNGVSIRLVPEYKEYHSGFESLLVDTTPDTPGKMVDAPLRAGLTYTDPVKNLSIKTNSVSPSGASVTVTLPTNAIAADTNVPSVPPNFKLTPQNSTSIYLDWDHSSDDSVRNYTRYSVYRGSTLIASTYSDFYTDTGLTPETSYQYSVSAIDSYGNVSPKTSSLTARTYPADSTPPAAPELSAAINSPYSVSLTWTPSSDNVGLKEYVIYRDGTQRVAWSPTIRTYDELYLNRNTTYNFHIVARDHEGNTAQSNTVTITTPDDTAAPTQPTNLIATPAGPSQINLTWNQSDDADPTIDYLVYRGTSLIRTTTNSSNHYVDTGRTANTSYSYRVVARDSASLQSASSPTVSATTPNSVIDTTAPTAFVSGIGSGIFSGSVDLGLSVTDDQAIAKVEFYIDYRLRSTDTTAPYSYRWDTTQGGNGSHCVSRRSYDTSNNVYGLTSCVNVGNPTDPPGDTTPPVTSITAPTANSNVNGNVNIQASATDENSVTKVEFFIDSVLRSTDTSSPYEYGWDTTDVTNGAHVIEVRSFDSSNNQGNSSISVTVANPDTQLPTVTITSPSEGATVSSTVDITASANDNVGVARVEFLVDGVLRSTDTSSPYSYSWNSTDVSNGAHSLSTRAFDAAGNSASDDVTVTVSNGDTQAPSPPSGLIASAPAYNRVQLNWAASTDNVGVTGYWIIRNGTTIGSSATNSYTDTGVNASTSYTYYVIAYDAAGNNSANSNTANVTTPAAPDTQAPNAPSNLSANAVSSSQVNLSWGASSDNIGVTGYDVYRGPTKVATVTATSYGDTGLSASTTYSYTIVARDAAGNTSPSSNTATATTQAPPPPPQSTGAIRGRVNSSSGGVIVGAKVQTTINGAKTTYTTNSSGDYTMESVPPGNYSLKFTATHHQAQTKETSVTSGSTNTVDATLLTRR